MSHPAAHTLEHIEKQQRSITPQPTTVQSIIPNNNSNNINNNINKITSASKIKRHINKHTTTQLESVSHELQRQTNITTTIETNGTTSFHRIQSPITPARQQQQQLNHNSSKTLFTNDGQAMGLSSTVRNFFFF